MLHAHIFSEPAPAPTDFHLLPPLTPADYLRICRKASGKSVDQVAEVIEPRHRRRSAVAALIRDLETPGTTANHVTLLDPLHGAFRFSSDVYFQLMTRPPERHPIICRQCGCDRHHRCHHEEIGDCDWTLPGLCSRCADGERC
ncbi:hypothetical protein [Sphingomonas aracearum]|uniref:Uncharacterized protein n=1 Tax=Sphingomonas aracearum TaxID=2283317 RepID=A0A369VQJ6_9SPHN|nr:hypothetical protein [Sphingomonas aracearum]RDE04668.1 hypothetical protein DVW87_13840 [Sphingomonas aracearum]